MIIDNHQAPARFQRFPDVAQHLLIHDHFVVGDEHEYGIERIRLEMRVGGGAVNQDDVLRVVLMSVSSGGAQPPRLSRIDILADYAAGRLGPGEFSVVLAHIVSAKRLPD